MTVDAFSIAWTKQYVYIFAPFSTICVVLRKIVEDEAEALVVARLWTKVSNGAKIRNRYNQVPHLTQDTNGKVTNSQKTPQTRAKRSALSQQVTTKHI